MANKFSMLIDRIPKYIIDFYQLPNPEQEKTLKYQYDYFFLEKSNTKQNCW